MPNLTYDTEAEWKAIRAKHVGASEVSALFGLSPWLTRWQLYHLKRGTLPDVLENTSMTQGKFFEPAIAAYAQEKFSITLRKVRRYLSHDSVPGMGASLDYEEYGDGTLIPTEMKWSLYGDGWDWEGEELTAIPDAYMMQVQHQMACAGAERGQLIAFTGGDLKRMLIPRSERMVSAIEDAVRTFWADVTAAHEPPVDFSVDAEAIGRLAYATKLRPLTMGPEDARLFEAWDAARTMASQAEERAKAARAEVLKRVIDAGAGNDTAVKVVCGDWRMSVSKVAENLGKEITPEMLGTRMGARKGYLTTRLTKAKEG